MSAVSSAGPLSDDEFRTFLGMLHRFCENELDQYECWRLDTTYGEVYIDISRRPFPGASREAYDRLEFQTRPDEQSG
jgi:hypothetical protein